jgi:hypothetical protein
MGTVTAVDSNSRTQVFFGLYIAVLIARGLILNEYFF